MDKISAEQANVDRCARLVDVECEWCFQIRIFIAKPNYQLPNHLVFSTLTYDFTVCRTTSDGVYSLENILSELKEPIKRSATQVAELYDSLKSELRIVFLYYKQKNRQSI